MVSDLDSQLEDTDVYAGCLLSNFGSCGPYLPRNEKELVPLKTLNNAVSDHFACLGIKALNQNCFKHDITAEKGLVCQRANLSKKVSEDGLICPKHRYTYGIYYRPSKLCLHPEHVSTKKNKKVNCHSVPTRFNNFLQNKYKCHLPVGFKLCTKCRNGTLAAMQNIDADEQAAKDDEDFNLHYSSLSKDSFNATLSSIDEEISPIKFSTSHTN